MIQSQLSQRIKIILEFCEIYYGLISKISEISPWAFFRVKTVKSFQKPNLQIHQIHQIHQIQLNYVIKAVRKNE
jgi:hypothetical protein